MGEPFEYDVDAQGDKLVFWGGGLDTQHVLPFGPPEQVREQVRDRYAAKKTPYL